MAPKKNALAAMMKQSREVSKSPEAKKRRVEVPQPGGVKEVLEVFKDGLEGTYEEQQKKLYEAAAALMTHFELDINGSMWRLAELEAYVYHDTHPDAYTHRNDDQLELCSWYFHRQGNGSYKGGTYKGMDLTFGCRENKLYGGFLVRSIQEVRTNAVVEGPCLVVNKILELNQVGSIADFAAGRNGAQLNVEETEGLLLKLAKNGAGSGRPVHSAPRVGLTLRSGSDKVKFCARGYRFSTIAASIKKFKAGFVAVAVSEGMTTAAIMDAFNMKPKLTSDYMSAFEKGVKSSDYSAFIDNVLNSTEICEMFGATRKSF
eukprot:TRINITY_DN8223_c0_g1_i2.p1 TRINITY_DN8223_c0_g1~~TRINITY_DN8223_c0_g1_i2.p1  ORF type:complete len:317 (+),score=77.95 TRINITY_DN8223_c0_g1_i2:38-988(+)